MTKFSELEDEAFIAKDLIVQGDKNLALKRGFFGSFSKSKEEKPITEYFQEDYKKKISFKKLFMSPKRIMKNKLLGYSHVEQLTRSATCNDKSYPKIENFMELARCTHDDVQLDQIMDVIKKRMLDTNDWRHVHNALILLNYLITHGNKNVFERCTEWKFYSIIACLKSSNKGAISETSQTVLNRLCEWVFRCCSDLAASRRKEF
ncbi:hypothetical protein QYM36_016751 [Artemia franciscana]|uniref:ENTH domain-containing protein n=1 Tax=Artemia franciscana TaxID=6661 RepID=A0AA88H471_ARTSF|nr:hypothetical protein QYM36_016751 [Artemia franciscana]